MAESIRMHDSERYEHDEEREEYLQFSRKMFDAESTDTFDRK